MRDFQRQFASEEVCQDYLAACRWPVVVDAESQRKRTRPLSGVNGEVCGKRRKKDLTAPALLEMDGSAFIETYPNLGSHQSAEKRYSVLAGATGRPLKTGVVGRLLNHSTDGSAATSWRTPEVTTRNNSA